jgi:hypothetical protein
MPATDDDDRPKKKITHEIGQELTLLSVGELTERITLLEGRDCTPRGEHGDQAGIEIGGRYVLQEMTPASLKKCYRALTINRSRRILTLR